MTQASDLLYENLDVRIDRVGDEYRAYISTISDGEATSRANFSEILAGLDDFLLTVGHSRRPVRGRPNTRLSAAEQYGTALFGAVFHGEALLLLERKLENAASRAVGTRIRLLLGDAPALADIPWEFLYHPSRRKFLSLSSDTPVVRYLECGQRSRALRVNVPLRILVVMPDPVGFARLDVEREWEALTKALKPLSDRGLVALEHLEHPQFEFLPRALKKGFHILHFIGHGEFSEDGGALIFEDDKGRGVPISATELAIVLSDQKSLGLVVLNACEGARSSTVDPFSGTAQTLIRQGIPAVLAMQFEITDKAAITFASEFYTSVAAGDPIDSALADSRRGLFAHQRADVEWATPVLYLRAPDGRIFDVPEIDKPIAPPEDRPTPPPPKKPAKVIPPAVDRTDSWHTLVPTLSTSKSAGRASDNMDFYINAEPPRSYTPAEISDLRKKFLDLVGHQKAIAVDEANKLHRDSVSAAKLADGVTQPTNDLARKLAATNEHLFEGWDKIVAGDKSES